MTESEAKQALNIASPGDPVIQELAERRADRHRIGGDQAPKLGLVVEGGGMRGVISAGALAALDELGLTSAFDVIYAESAGAINSSYFLAGETHLGSSIYYEDLTGRQFVNLLRPTKMLDIDYLTELVMISQKPLGVDAVLASRTDLFISLTDVETAIPRVVKAEAGGQSLLETLKATASIVPLYNHSVEIDGRAFVDGGITDPIPLHRAIESGCSRILVLLTRPPDCLSRPFPSYQKLLLWPLLQRWNPGFRHAFFNHRYRRYNEMRDLAFGRKASPRSCRISVICPGAETPDISRATVDGELLKAAWSDSRRRTLTLFEEPETAA